MHISIHVCSSLSLKLHYVNLKHSRIEISFSENLSRKLKKHSSTLSTQINIYKEKFFSFSVHLNDYHIRYIYPAVFHTVLCSFELLN